MYVCMYVCMNYIAVSTLWTLTPPDNWDHVVGKEHLQICAQSWHRAIVLDNGDVLSSHVRSNDMLKWSHDVQMAPYVRSDDMRKL
jgi:hypothetical protein